MFLSSCFYVVLALKTRIVLYSLDLNYMNMNNFTVSWLYFCKYFTYPDDGFFNVLQYNAKQINIK